jgi:hypothetical protein
MDRRDFMKKVCEAGTGSAFILAAAGVATGAAASAAAGATPAQSEGKPAGTSAAESAAEAARAACEKDRKFSQEWVVNAVGNMEGKLDEKSEILVLEECGRACARKGAVKTAIENKGDLEGFLKVMRGWIGDRNVIREPDAVTLVFDKCYCPNLSSFEGTVPSSYCNCSRGWMKEMFETVTGKPCDVALLSSVKRGDKECRLAVQV